MVRVVVRIGQAITVLFMTMVLTYVLLSIMPGDAIEIRFRNPDLGLTEAQIADMREFYGQDSNIVVGFFHTLGGYLTGDFGVSLSTGLSVSKLIGDAIPYTLRLGASAFALAIIIGTSIGWLANGTRSKRLSALISMVPSLFVSIPTFWLGILLIQTVSFQLGLIDITSGSSFELILLPVIALAVPLSAPIAQVFTRSLKEAALEPFVNVAAARGASRWWILRHHLTKYAALPTLTMAGITLGHLITGSVITEIVFARPGLGRLTESAVSSQDLPVLQAIVIIAAFVFVTANLLVDLAYARLDPRIRTAGARA